MAKKCEISGTGVMSGNNVSHANNRTRRRFLPNLQEVSLLSESLGKVYKLRICTKTLRSIEHKGGLDAYLMNTPDSKLSEEAKKKIEFINSVGKSNLPVIIAKTQFSLTDNKDLVGRPKGFKLFVRDIELKTGSGFIVVIAGDMMLMPGLSKVPNAEKIDIDNNGTITGLS